MSWYHDDSEYESAAARKARIAKEVARRVKRGETFTAFEAPAGTRIVKNFWGLAWCRHLENYCGYDNRLPKGRTYLRQGHVYNLEVKKGRITADVTGSEIYEVEITIQPLPPGKWEDIRRRCEGQVASLLDLLSGKPGGSVMKIVADPETGLFPSRREISHFCSCPDSADLCKHRAAVLYAVGVLFDRDPQFLFELRGADPSGLIASSAAALTASSGVSTGSGILDASAGDLSDLFGIDLADDGESPPSGVPSGSGPPPRPRTSRPLNQNPKRPLKSKSSPPPEPLPQPKPKPQPKPPPPPKPKPPRPADAKNSEPRRP